MTEPLTIEKTPKLEHSEDYHFLREEGINYLQKLGSRLWTDYNIHDPGVTILEMLCYAITDLGYRTSYDISDLLALTEGSEYFHTAREILTVNPTTVNDYRKLIIDVEGVENAWLETSKENECPIYVDLKNGRLSYVPSSVKQEPLFLNGLYSVLLQFEEDEEFGDLNDPVIKQDIVVDDEDATIEFVFPTWKSLVDEEGERRIRSIMNRGVITNIKVNESKIEFDADNKGYRFPVKVRLEYQEEAQLPKPGFACEKDLPFDKFSPEIPPTLPDINNRPLQIAEITMDLLVRYPGRASDYQNVTIALVEDNARIRLIDFFRQKMAYTLDIVDRVVCRLMDHRNLCEDYFDIDSLKTEEIAVCADIEVQPDADVEKVMAQIAYELGNFISPPINFYTLQQLFDEGMTADQVFNGPALEHGFIKNEELDKAILLEELRTSDLINIIMDVPGVMAVKELQVANYIDGKAQTDGEYWVLPLTNDGKHVPKLSLEKSKFLFFKDVLPYRADLDEVEELLAEIIVRNRSGRLKETPLDLEIPEGEDLDVQKYTTIQNDFPLTYGIGVEGIPGMPDDKRKAQSKQLKGFLLFFDQMLADYMAQLAHVKDLFSMDPCAKERTYFTQPVEDVHCIEDLYMDHGETVKIKDCVEAFEADCKDDAAKKFIEECNRQLGSSLGIQCNKPPCDDDAATIEVNAVWAYLNSIAENRELFESRKNRFLDHLLARFAESFNEYALLMYALRGDKAGQELIEDKLAFLNDYPAISRDRGKAFNYKPRVDCKVCWQDRLWNTTNVSGFKKRIARLMGFDHYHRRNLTGHGFSVRKIEYTTRDDVWIWQLKDPTDPGRILMHSVEYETEESAKFMISYAIAMVELGNLVKNDGTTHNAKCCERVGVDDLSKQRNLRRKNFVILNPCGDVIACSERRYSDEQLRDCDYELTKCYILNFCTVEGFHLVEHILLRPQFKKADGLGYRMDQLLPICVEGVDGRSFQQELLESLYTEMFLDGANQWRFRIRDKRGQIVLRSEGYSSVEAAQNGVEAVADNILLPKRYKMEQTNDGRYFFNIIAGNNEVIASSRHYDTPQERQVGIDELLCLDPNAEGAKVSNQNFLCLEEEDPYSFRVSIVLPSWAGRFRDINFRQLVEKTMRMEAPAHIHLRICWVDRDQMAEFECALMEWLLVRGDCDSRPRDVSPKLNNLIDVLYNLQNVYPVATLHDCDDDAAGTGAQVVLNYTSLGTL